MHANLKIVVYAVIIIILVVAFASVNVYKGLKTNETSLGSCNAPTDCEKQDLAHIMCVGSWVCEQNRCGWVCGIKNESTGNGGLSGSTVECYDDGHCTMGKCPDNTAYKRFSCLDYRCVEINYFADPCKYR